MAELVFTEGFISDAASVRLPAKRDEVRRVVELLGDFPRMGSPAVPESLRSAYGTGVRKLAVSPFDIVYEDDDANDEVLLYALVHQRCGS